MRASNSGTPVLMSLRYRPVIDLGPQRVPERCASARGHDERERGSRRSRECTDPPPQVVWQASERGAGDAVVLHA